ncbi:MAG: hypothetical protein M1115_09220 [Actinobacteria bacterium]|nr:hypothetical protein [Actinomycetota bacterium]
MAELLPLVVDGTEQASRNVVSHVGSCLRCQAELAKYRRLLRLLHRLQHQGLLSPPESLAADLIACIEAAAERTVAHSALRGRRLAYLIGVAGLMGAAGVSGIIVSGGHHRRVRPRSLEVAG